jgi:hypothetical protein
MIVLLLVSGNSSFVPPETIAGTEEQAALFCVLPTDLERRLYLPKIFSAADLMIPNADYMAELPNSINQNIFALKLAIQQNKLYVQPLPSTTFEESSLNTILLSTFTSHGKSSIKNDFNEIHLIASALNFFLTPFFTPHDQIQIEWDTTSWIYNQLNKVKVKAKKSPDINFHVQSGDKVVEIGCGEVKKDKVGEVEAKARVIEMMKRQLHLRMQLTKKMHEAATFAILVIGTEITLFKIHIDTSKWVYVYEKSRPFTSPTTYATYQNTDVAMAIMLGFKV